MRNRAHWAKLQSILMSVWAQSMRGRPTILFRPVLVKRGKSSVPGSKTTRRRGSVSGRRKMCPNQRSCERKIWMLKRVAWHRLRVVALETRLKYGCGMPARVRSIEACAPSNESRKAFLNEQNDEKRKCHRVKRWTYKRCVTVYVQTDTNSDMKQWTLKNVLQQNWKDKEIIYRTILDYIKHQQKMSFIRNKMDRVSEHRKFCNLPGERPRIREKP
jgi:hypothetical protein